MDADKLAAAYALFMKAQEGEKDAICGQLPPGFQERWQKWAQPGFQGGMDDSHRELVQYRVQFVEQLLKSKPTFYDGHGLQKEAQHKEVIDEDGEEEPDSSPKSTAVQD